jgi:hypothetical protein
MLAEDARMRPFSVARIASPLSSLPPLHASRAEG